MVSLRCKMVVKSELDKLGLHHCVVDLGEVNVLEDLTELMRNQLRIALLKSGLELMDDEKSVLIEQVKIIIVEMIHYTEENVNLSPSDFISEKLGLPYRSISTIFSEVTGTTIENFLILHKIERVKELLLYEELSLTEIASQLNYHSVGHLSDQFRKITGLTTAYFKGLKEFRRQNTLSSV